MLCGYCDQAGCSARGHAAFILWSCVLDVDIACAHRQPLAAAILDLVLLQIAGGQRYRPPAVDVNAPDLFIPLMGLWSYALLSCVVLAFKHAFKPEMMSSTVRQQQLRCACNSNRAPSSSAQPNPRLQTAWRGQGRVCVLVPLPLMCKPLVWVRKHNVGSW